MTLKRDGGRRQWSINAYSAHPSEMIDPVKLHHNHFYHTAVRISAEPQRKTWDLEAHRKVLKPGASTCVLVAGGAEHVCDPDSDSGRWRCAGAYTRRQLSSHSSPLQRMYPLPPSKILEKVYVNEHTSDSLHS